MYQAEGRWKGGSLEGLSASQAGKAEKAMATHSSTLAWRIPGTGEPGELLSMGSHTTEATQQQQAGKESACSAGDLGSIPGLGRSPGERKGYPLPVFWPGEFHGLYCLWGCKESDMTEQLSLTLKMPSGQWTGMFHQLSGDGALDKKWSESHSVVLDCLLSHGL